MTIQSSFNLFDNLYYLALGCGFYLAYLIWYHRNGTAIGTAFRPDLSQIPGGVPLFGNMIKMGSDDRMVENYYINKRARVDKSKPLSISIPFLRTIDISDPISLEYVQKTNFQNYKKGKLVGGIMKDILGEGIFAVDGDLWHKARKATSKIFSANSFRGIISTSVEKDLTKLKNIVNDHAQKSEPFDLASLFFAFTLSSFTSLAFGYDVGSLDSSTPIPFAAAFDFAQTVMDDRSLNPFWPITELFSSDGRKMRKAAKTIEDFAYTIIDEREEKAKLRKLNGETEGREKDLLELYMSIRDEKGEGLTRSALRDATVNLIIAGRDTTAQALSWTFFHLLSNPEYLKNIQKEIDSVEVIDFDNFRELKYTLAAFHEGLRLHPSVPKNGWEAIADDVLPNGVQVRKGDRAFWVDWEMGRNTEIWGEDAALFKPERWINKEDGSLIKESMWKFHAFNGGNRLCLGQQLALYEATVVMAKILRDFDLTFAPNYLETVEMIDISAAGNLERTPRYSPSLTLPMKDPFMVVAKPRVV